MLRLCRFASVVSTQWPILHNHDIAARLAQAFYNELFRGKDSYHIESTPTMQHSGDSYMPHALHDGPHQQVITGLN